MCKPALFYVTLPVSEGRPDIDCVNGMFDILASGTQGGGVIGFFSGIVMLTGFSFSIPLFFGSPKYERGAVVAK